MTAAERSQPPVLQLAQLQLQDEPSATKAAISACPEAGSATGAQPSPPAASKALGTPHAHSLSRIISPSNTTCASTSATASAPGALGQTPSRLSDSTAKSPSGLSKAPHQSSQAAAISAGGTGGSSARLPRSRLSAASIQGHPPPGTKASPAASMARSSPATPNSAARLSQPAKLRPAAGVSSSGGFLQRGKPPQLSLSATLMRMLHCVVNGQAVI